MKLRNFILAFLVIIITGITNKTYADHFAAGDLYLVYTGAGQDGCTGTTEYKYDLTFDWYRACDPGNAPIGPYGTIGWRSANAGLSGSYNLANFTLTRDTLDQLCDTFHRLSSCFTNVATSPLGFERGHFVYSITLPSAQTDWTFWFASCCTSNFLNNVPWYQPFYLECGLNNVVKYNNSTPRFAVSPLPYLCVNQPSVFLNGPSDPNYDSTRTYNIVHYTHTSPLAAPTWLTYTPPYSLLDPIGSAASNPWRVDSLTGAAYFTPTNTGRFTFDFQCDEYDVKTKIKTGYIRRTCEVNVFNCTYPPPTVDTIPLTVTGGTLLASKKQIITCPGNNLQFSVTGKALNAVSRVVLEADISSTPGATFTITGQFGTNPSGVFNWTPTVNDYGDHNVTITSKDSTCNTTGTLIVQKNYTVIKIRVLPGLDAGKDQAFCELNPTPKQLYVRGTDYLTSFKWTDISGGPAKNLSADNIVDPVASPTKTTSYVVSSPDLVANCRSRDTVTVYADTSNKVDIFPVSNPFVLCRPDYLQLDAITTGKGPLSNFNCGPTVVPPTTSLDSVNIYGSSIFGTGFSYDTNGVAAPLLYNTVYTTKQQFLLTRADLKEYGLRAATINGLMFETAKCTAPTTFIYNNFTISLKCVDSTKKFLDPVTGFEPGTVPVYIASGPTYFPNGVQTFNFNIPYNIDDNKGLIVEICYANPDTTAGCTLLVGAPPLIKYMPTTYASALELKPLYGVSASNVCSKITDPQIKAKNGRPVFRFYYHDAPYLPFQYKWFPGAYLSDSNSKNPLAYVSKSTDYSVQTFGNSGCIIRDTMSIHVPIHDFSVTPKDTSICFGEVAPLEVRKGVYYQWFEYENGKYMDAHKSLSCDYCSNPIAKPLKSTHYKIKVGDEVFCYDTIDAYIEVRPLPLVNILNNDTVVKYGQSVQLLVNGARTYNWTPVSSINNPNISYPVATPSEATMYVACGIGTNGCRAYDTVRVGLDYRDNLFIPSAFSPNGDGKNDMFRVSNMTFQRFVEFRVFNKWGQEVYNGGGGNPNKGWDGTWKGVAQDMGTYQYLIRVGYPDGLVETYKGDVTLIR